MPAANTRLAKTGRVVHLTMTTKYKSGNGLTPSAANRPAFPSAKRYPQEKKTTVAEKKLLNRRIICGE